MKGSKLLGTQPSCLQESTMNIELIFSRICQSQGDVPRFVIFHSKVSAAGFLYPKAPHNRTTDATALFLFQDYGGYLSTYMLPAGEENQVFACGAALSPLTDFKLYGNPHPKVHRPSR